MSYGKFHQEFWDGEKITPLSDRACLLAAYLITGPHRNAIGCFKLGIGAITDVDRFGEWGSEGVSKALQEMADTGFIVRDDRTNWTFITNALTKDPIISPKGAIHALTLANAVPKNLDVYKALAEKLAPQLEAYEKVLTGKPGYPMACSSEAPSVGHTKPQASPLPTPNPNPKPQPGGARAPRFEAPDWIPADAWRAFEEMRQRVRKPMTNKAREMIVGELDGLRRAGHEPGEVLLQSVKNSWQGVFPLKGKPAPVASAAAVPPDPEATLKSKAFKVARGIHTTGEAVTQDELALMLERGLVTEQQALDYGWKPPEPPSATESAPGLGDPGDIPGFLRRQA